MQSTEELTVHFFQTRAIYFGCDLSANFYTVANMGSGLGGVISFIAVELAEYA